METEGKDKDREGEGGWRERSHMGVLAEREPWAGTAPTGPSRASGRVCKRRGVRNEREPPFLYWMKILPSIYYL